MEACRTISHPTPVVTLTFSINVILLTIDSAFLYASCQDDNVPPRASKMVSGQTRRKSRATHEWGTTEATLQLVETFCRRRRRQQT